MNGSESKGEPGSVRSVNWKENRDQDQGREEAVERSADGSGEDNDGWEDEDHYSRGCFMKLISSESACADAGNTCLMALDSKESACAAAGYSNRAARACAFAEPAYPTPANRKITALGLQLALKNTRGNRLLQEQELVTGGAADRTALIGDAPNAPDVACGEPLLLGDSLEEARVTAGASNLAVLVGNTTDGSVMADQESFLIRDALEEGPVAGTASNLAVVVGDALEEALGAEGEDDRAELMGDKPEFPNDFPNDRMALHADEFGCAGDRKPAGQSGETWEEGGRGGEQAGLDSWMLEDLLPLDGLTLEGVTEKDVALLGVTAAEGVIPEDGTVQGMIPEGGNVDGALHRVAFEDVTAEGVTGAGAAEGVTAAGAAEGVTVPGATEDEVIQD
ncbi:unnamed protein product [Closterium sp. NIES-65]|nr:unnamed protein product [Closterium sp. NIES-65]